jgi:putative restriction endonuclease
MECLSAFTGIRKFENGRDYYALHGKPIREPQAPAQKPDPAALTWHNEHCFRG